MTNTQHPAALPAHVQPLRVRDDVTVLKSSDFIRLFHPSDAWSDNGFIYGQIDGQTFRTILPLSEIDAWAARAGSDADQ